MDVGTVGAMNQEREMEITERTVESPEMLKIERDGLREYARKLEAELRIYRETYGPLKR